MARKKSFKIKNTFTFILAVIIIIVAIVLYLRKTDFNFFVSSSSASATMIGDGDNATGILKIHFIDIGQGDCTFIELPDGNTMLIDSGNRGNGDTITNYITALGYTEIDLLMATHSDADHVGSMKEIFENFKITF